MRGSMNVLTREYLILLLRKGQSFIKRYKWKTCLQLGLYAGRNSSLQVSEQSLPGTQLPEHRLRGEEGAQSLPRGQHPETPPRDSSGLTSPAACAMFLDSDIGPGHVRPRGTSRTWAREKPPRLSHRPCWPWLLPWGEGELGAISWVPSMYFIPITQIFMKDNVHWLTGHSFL